MNFSWIGVVFQALFTQPIFNALMLLYRLFGDFGLAIVVLTLIIKLILFPLTLKQLKSSKNMQVLQPQMAEIRRKHPKDRQAQALAMQALYKEYNINPLAGCLPLLIQLPVLYGLFFAFNTILRSTHLTSDINGLLYPFITHFASFDPNLNWFRWLNPHWFISLAQPEPYPIHFLVIIAALATFVQMRMSMPRTAQTTTKAKSDQPDPTTSTMKAMQFIMPVFTLVIGWSFPAGLALYWTVSYVFQAVQQYFVTGWGSLLIKPNISLKPESSTIRTSGSSNGVVESRKESVKGKLPVEDAEDLKGDMATAGSTALASRLPSANSSRSSSNGSSAQRRSRNSSASARRRGTQRSRR